jgi:glycolate oxidase iron-sulfur subunit
MHLIDRARAHVEANYRRPIGERVVRALVAALIPRPRLFGFTLRTARPLKQFARWMPSRLKPLLDLVPAQHPPPSEPLTPGTYAAQGTRKARVMLLPGCAQQVLAPSINAATVRLLRRAGCEVVVPKRFRCCGALTLHMGRDRQAQQNARALVATLRATEATGAIDAIAINASGCGSTVKDYGHLLGNSPADAVGARRVAQLALDVTELLVRIGLPAAVSNRALSVAYHDACSLRNRQRVTAQPRALLAAAGFAVHNIAETHLCCGSAGTYNMLQPAAARLLGERKAAHIALTDADVVAVGNIGCITQLGRYCDRPVLHTVELLDWATGGPRPACIAHIDSSPLIVRRIEQPPSQEAIW